MAAGKIVFSTAIIVSAFLPMQCHREKGTHQHPPPSGRLKYAQGFDYEPREDGYLLSVFHQQKKKPSRYLLQREGTKQAHPSHPLTVTVIAFPLKRIAVSSTTHAGYLSRLGLIDNITAFSQPQYLSHPRLLQNYRAGKLVRFGALDQPDVETLIKHRVQAVITDPLDGPSKKRYRVLEKAGIAVIPIEAYLEAHPLARLEWLYFFALLFDRLELAKEYFLLAQLKYRALLRRACGVQPKFHPP